MKQGCAVVSLVICAIAIGLAILGEKISSQADAPHTDNMALLDDAQAALAMKLRNASTRELHVLTKNQVICGQVNHDESEVGFAPFAYNHSLGLSVAKVWGKGEPERLNRDYGCKFLPLAYTNEWTKPFWGGQPDGDTYIP